MLDGLAGVSVETCVFDGNASRPFHTLAWLTHLQSSTLRLRPREGTDRADRSKDGWDKGCEPVKKWLPRSDVAFRDEDTKERACLNQFPHRRWASPA